MLSGTFELVKLVQLIFLLCMDTNVNDSFYLVTFHICLGYVPDSGLEVKGIKNFECYPDPYPHQIERYKFHNNLWAGHC